MADNDNDNEAAESTIDFGSLSDEQKAALASHPQVRKMLEYEQTSIPSIVSMLRNLRDGEENEDTFNLYVEGIAERSGRVTESTVRKVMDGMIEEHEAVSE